MKIIRTKNPVREITLPTTLEECSVSFFVKFAGLSHKSELERLAGLLDMDVETLMGMDASDVDTEIYSGLMWWIDAAEQLNSYPVPKTIRIDGQVVAVPKDLKEKTFGQYIELKNLIKAIDNNPENYFSNIVAAFSIYMAPVLGQSRERVEQLAQGLKIVDVYPIVSFFLRKYRPLLSDSRKHSGLLTRLKRAGRALTVLRSTVI